MNQFRLVIIFSFLWFISFTSVIGQVECAGDQGRLRYYFWNDIPGNSIDKLTEDERYPNTPDGFVLLTGLKTSQAFNDNYGGRIRGYINPSETGEFVFFVDGDHEVDFYLSSDSTSENLSKVCEIFKDVSDGIDEYPEQTSETIQLVEGEYYFFELLHKELTAGDYANISWKTPSNPNEYNIIEGVDVYDYTCDIICPTSETSCDDNNPNTINDIEDGQCNCYGTPTEDCIGNRGDLRVFYYEGIPGQTLDSLLAAPIYPDSPNNGESLSACYFDPAQDIEYGALIKAFIRIPITGDYTFQLAGNNESEFLLSNSTSHEAEDLNQVAYLAWNQPNQMDTSQIVSLTGGEYYYLEIRNKGNGNGDVCYLNWKLPGSTEFESIESDYFYSFLDCDDICVPDGLPCNDNNIMTYQDQYVDCNCQGQPCDVPDCSNNENYIPFSSCNTSDQHVNNKLDSWLSCEVSPNPNTNRPDGHWVMFNLKESYKLHTSHIWNYNVEDETAKGFKEIVIDYSLNGLDWIEYGTYTWEQASGLTDYNGFEGPDFGGLQLNYLLVTAITNWNNDDCAGFSEWQMILEKCPDIPVTNILGSEEITIGQEEIYIIENANPNSTYEWTANGGTIITSDNEQATILWDGGTLEVCVTETTANGCIGSMNCQSIEIISDTKNLLLKESAILYPNPTSGIFTIQLSKELSLASVYIYNTTGVLVLYQNDKEIDIKELPSGVYLVKLETDKGAIFKKISLLK